MKFWKKYKVRKKLEKARFVNFYEYSIDLSLGRIKELICYSRETSEKDGIWTVFIINYYIILRYDNFKEIFLCYGKDESIRDNHICELKSFGESDKFKQLLNQYEKLKEKYEQLL